MANRSPADIIEAYRRRQGRRFPFTFSDLSQAVLVFLILGSSAYFALTGRPELPTIIELKTNTPTIPPSITPTPSASATLTLTPTYTLAPTETPDMQNQCNCPSPQVLVVTATFEATSTSLPGPTGTEPPTLTAPEAETLTPAASPTSNFTLSPTRTSIVYTVQRGDTLGGIALRFGVTVEAIQALNNMESTIIYAGQVLQIPAP